MGTRQALCLSLIFWSVLGFLYLESFDMVISTTLSSSRGLLGSQKTTNGPILIGGVGVGLFSIIFIGVVSIVACVGLEGSENPTFTKILLALMNGLVVLIIFVLPKKKRGEPSTTYQEGEFYSSWLWLNALIYAWFGIGLLVCLAMMISHEWGMPIYALEDDRMSRKG